MHVVERRAIGQWFSVDLDSGEEQWSTRGGRANTFCGVDSGVIVASEMRSDGPWTLDFGVYGRSLETGEPLWTSHREGVRGQVLAWLDKVPGFTNGFRDRPLFVRDGRCFCNSGRVLDVTSGALIGRHQETFTRPPDPAQRLYQDGRVELTQGWLSARTERGELVVSFARGGTQAYARTFAGVGGNYFSYRLAGNALFVISQNAKGAQLLMNGTRHGEVIASAQLTLDPNRHARIETVSDEHLLVSIDGRDLWCFSLNSLPSYRHATT